MRHFMALVIKSVMVITVLFVTLNVMNDYPEGSTFVLSFLVAGLSYLVGDLGILPMSNNTVATLSDLGLSTLTIWLIGPMIVGGSIPFSIALVSGIVISAGEWFFHKFMIRSVMPRKDAM